MNRIDERRIVEIDMGYIPQRPGTTGLITPLVCQTVSEQVDSLFCELRARTARTTRHYVGLISFDSANRSLENCSSELLFWKCSVNIARVSLSAATSLHQTNDSRCR